MYMPNKPHSEETKAKIRQARLGKGKWVHLPQTQIVKRLLTTTATTRSLAVEYGCSDSTIKIILRKHTTKEQRLKVRYRKQGLSLTGRENPQLKKWRQSHNVWRGRKHTAEARRKQSLSHRGKKSSMKQRIAQSASLQGITIEEWNGFATTEEERQKASVEFSEWRKAIFERDDYTCRLCAKSATTLHPHHIKSFAKYPELRFDITNGITLCSEPCHKQTHGKEEQFEALFLNLIIGRTVNAKANTT